MDIRVGTTWPSTRPSSSSSSERSTPCGATRPTSTRRSTRYGRLTYTRQVLNEALRLWPTAAAFSRYAREDTLLGGRVPLLAGQAVTVLGPMLHRQPVWGDTPGLFDPSRFTAEAEEARSPHAFKPSGTGERACIGRQFALHEATMLLAMLVHRYRPHDHADYALTVKERPARRAPGVRRDPDARRAIERPAPCATSAYEVRTLTGGPLHAVAERHGLTPMTVTEAYDLTAPGHSRTKRCVRLAPPEGTTYRTGDHLTVLPVNDPALVHRAVTALGLDPEEVLDIRSRRGLPARRRTPCRRDHRSRLAPARLQRGPRRRRRLRPAPDRRRYVEDVHTAG